MNCKIIVFEGTDSSGKGTQATLLHEHIAKCGFNVKQISFPNYGSESCKDIEDYLQGKVEYTPDEIGIKYALDRQAYFKQNDISELDYLIIDRYVGSNFIHQCSKLTTEEDKDLFIEWFLKYEYQILGIPKPTIEIFVDMPREFADKLMDKRGRSDIHENDKPYLERCYQDAKTVSRKLQWRTVSCVYENELKTIEQIHQDVLNIVGF